jgi:hypothetical protein
MSAVNKGYDALPPRSAQFTIEWDTPFRVTERVARSSGDGG